MKYSRIVSLFLFISPLTHTAVAPYIQPRSQSVDDSRELVGWTHFINLFDEEKIYGATACTLEYTHTFWPDKIANSMFAPNLQDTSTEGEFIGISGSQYPNRNSEDLLADYFGLPTDFRSIIQFKPVVTNIILDLDFYIGLDPWLCGLYFRVHAPIVHTWWNLGYCETVTSPGVNNYAPGYFNDSTTGVSRGYLLNSFGDYVSAGLVPNLGTTVSFESLAFARMSRKTQSLTRVSDLEAAFGWNFVQSDNYHFGLNLRATAPCGNRPKGEYLFEPMIGNGHHWGLGIGLTSHWELWRDDHGEQCAGLYIDANIGTLFKANQIRVFDLYAQPLSRYMLAELLGTPVVNLYASTSAGSTSGATAPNLQFQNILRPVANLTAQSVQSSFPFQANVTVLGNYSYNSWSLDLAYDFWTVACEKLKPGCCVSALNDNTNWALKGDAYVYGFVASDAIDLPSSVTPNEAIPLSATESQATINAGTNTPFGTPFASSQARNPNIDNPQYALVYTADDSDQIMVTPNTVHDPLGTPANQQRTSLNPVLIGDTDLDIDGARVGGLSHKLVLHLSYTGSDHRGWSPYIGIGGKAEFARHLTTDCCANSCDGCLDTNFSEWGIWLKGGAAF